MRAETDANRARTGACAASLLQLFNTVALAVTCAAVLYAADFAGWVIGQGGQVTLDSSGRIEAVKLGFSWVSDRDADRLAQLRQLRSLDLSFSLLTDAGMERIRTLRGVRDLNLYAVERITDTAIAYIRGWSDLERLNLRGTDITDTSLQYIGALPSLKALDISHTQVTNIGLEHLTSLGSLEELYAGGNKLTGAALRVLKPLANLRVLDLNGIQKRNSGLWSVSLTDFDMETLAGFPMLEKLSIAGATVGDPGIERLSRLQRLLALDLSCTGVSGRGLDQISALPIELLTLWKAAAIDDSAAAALSRFSRVRVLDLSDTKISDATLRQIQPLPLRRLYVGGTAVTAAGIQAFLSRHPDCEVSWQ
jgi:hypothetical protein